MSPVLDELARQYGGRVKFVRVDMTSDSLIPSQQKITATPTLVFFFRGSIVNRVTGLVPKEDVQRHLDYLAGL